MGQVQHASRFPGSPHAFVVDEKPACNETLTQLHGDSTYELRGCCWVKAPSQNTIVSIRHTETVSHAKISSGFAASLLYEVQERFQSPQSTKHRLQREKIAGLLTPWPPATQSRGRLSLQRAERPGECLTDDGAGCELQGSHSAPTD